jgi:hypothetical protein
LATGLSLNPKTAQYSKVEMFRGSGAPIDTYAGTWFITAGMGLLALTGAAFLGFSFDG